MEKFSLVQYRFILQKLSALREANGIVTVAQIFIGCNLVTGLLNLLIGMNEIAALVILNDVITNANRFHICFIAQESFQGLCETPQAE